MIKNILLGIAIIISIIGCSENDKKESDKKRRSKKRSDTN